MVIQKTKRRRNCLYQIAVLILVAGAVIGIGCGGDQHQPTPTTDSAPPAQSITLSEARVQGASLAFRVHNPNSEDVRARITFRPALPDDAKFTVGENELTPGDDGSYMIAIPANETIQIQSNAIAADLPYTITAITADTSGNSRDDATPLSLMSADATAPANSVALSDVRVQSGSLAFKIRNPNEDEDVRARLAFAPKLPPGAKLTVDGSDVEATTGDVYTVPVPKGGEVEIQSSAIAAGFAYTITATTADTIGNFATRESVLSIPAPVILLDTNRPGTGSSIMFTATNSNNEMVNVSFTLNSERNNAPQPQFTYTDANDMTHWVTLQDGSYIAPVPASGMIQVRSNAIAAGVPYTITAITADESRNSRDDTTPLSLTSRDATPPAESVILAGVPIDRAGFPFAFGVINPNEDEAVEVGLTFNPALPDGAMLTYIDNADNNKRKTLEEGADRSFSLLLPADEQEIIRLMSSAITDGSEYTITAITADTNRNARSDSTVRRITADSYGDKIATAHPITDIDATIRGALSSNDSDYFRVTLNSSGGNNRLRVYSDYIVEGGKIISNTDTIGSVEVVDSMGRTTLLGRDDDSGSRNNFDLTAEIDASTDTHYYIKVTGKSGSAGRYALRLFFNSAPSFVSGKTPALTDTTKTSADFTTTADKDGFLYWGAYAYTKMPDGTLVAPARPVGAELDNLLAFALFRYPRYGIQRVTANAEATFSVSGLTADTKYDLYAFLVNNSEVASVMEKITFATTFYRDTNGVTILCLKASVGDSGVVGDTTYTKRATKADITEGNAPTTCTSGITDMSELFENKNTFNGNIGHWDTRGVTNMNNMFSGASAFTQDISIWNVGGVSSCSDFGITTNAPSFTSCTP